MAVVDAALASVVTAITSEEISALLQVQKLSKDELSNLQDSLNKKSLKELRSLAKSVSVRLTGSSRKHRRSPYRHGEDRSCLGSIDG